MRDLTKVSIVVGLGFGDEGKGRTTQFLAEESPNESLVIRFNGGQQAGHTVCLPDGRRHVCSQVGAGTLQGAATYWSSFCTIDIGALLKEWQALQALGISPKLYWDFHCPLTTHYDILFNRLQEEQRGAKRHGSCGMGFGTTIERHHFSPVKLHAFELAYPEIIAYKLPKIRAYYEQRCRELSLLEAFMQYEHDGADEIFLEQVEEINLLLVSKSVHLLNAPEIFTSKEYKHFIFEGAQGILLDMDFGFFPHVTRSHTTSRNAMHLIHTYLKEKLQNAPDLYYITRAYLSRHGAGYLPHEDFTFPLQHTEAETNTYNPYQEHFRKSPLQVSLLNYALDCDRSFTLDIPKHLVLTCIDQMPDSQIPVYRTPTDAVWMQAQQVPPLLSQNWESTLYSDNIIGDLKNFEK